MPQSIGCSGSAWRAVSAPDGPSGMRTSRLWPLAVVLCTLGSGDDDADDDEVGFCEDGAGAAMLRW